MYHRKMQLLLYITIRIYFINFMQIGGKMMNKKIQEYTTRELVEELSKREGVERKQADLYEKVELDVEGAAIILVVID